MAGAAERVTVPQNEMPKKMENILKKLSLFI